MSRRQIIGMLTIIDGPSPTIYFREEGKAHDVNALLSIEGVTLIEPNCLRIVMNESSICYVTDKNDRLLRRVLDAMEGARRETAQVYDLVDRAGCMAHGDRWVEHDPQMYLSERHRKSRVAEGATTERLQNDADGEVKPCPRCGSMVPKRGVS